MCRQKMATEQVNITETISQAAAEAARSDSCEGSQNAVPMIGGLFMKEPTFNWEAEDTYIEF